MMGHRGVRAVGAGGSCSGTPTFLQRTYHMSVGEAGVRDAEHCTLWGGGIATVVHRLPLMAGRGMTDAAPASCGCSPAGIGIRKLSPRAWCTTPATLLGALPKAMLWIFIPRNLLLHRSRLRGCSTISHSGRMRAMFLAPWCCFLANLGNLVIAPPAHRRLE